MSLTIPVAGIDIFMAKEIVFKLRQDTNLAYICSTTFELLQRSVDLINREMLVIFHEIEYWRAVAEATPFESVCINFLYQGPLHFLSMLRRCLFEKAVPSDDGTVDLRLSILYSTFNSFAALLGSLHHCGAELRKISTDYAIATSKSPSRSFAQSSEEITSGSKMSHDAKLRFYSSSQEHIAHCLDTLIAGLGALDEPYLNLEDGSSSVKRHHEILSPCADLAEKCDQARRTVCEAESEWPATVMANFVRRPTHFQRYWMRYAVIGAFSAYVAVNGIRHTLNGNMSRFIDKVVLIVQSNVKEHVMDPIAALVNELVDTLRRRDEIVTVEDLNQSRETLKRMLYDYSSRVLGTPGQLYRPDMGFDDAAMENLMKSYEAELSNPVRSLLFGNLISAMLIQMQKLKVHMEAAMLTMDKVLRSNELTMAVTAAIPGIAIMGGGIYGLYTLLFRPRRPPNRSEILMKLRLTLCEVDRAITNRAQHMSNDSQSKVNNGDDDFTESNSGEGNGLDLFDLPAGGNSVISATPSAPNSIEHSSIKRLDGIIYFEVFRFSELLKPLFLSSRHLSQGPWHFGCHYNSQLISKFLGWNGTRGACKKCSYSLSGFGANVSNEFDGIRRDLLDIVNPQNSASAKLQCTTRMRMSYKCLS